MMHLQDRVALVTGASRGIGAATAQALAAHGAAVAVNYCNSEQPARQVVAEIESHGGRALAVQADVRVQEQVAAMVHQVSEALGAIDILVLNASIEFPMLPFLEYPWPAFEAKLNGELRAAFFCCREVVPSMVERQQGSIIAISSTLSRHAAPGFCAHCTAKAGLDAFVRSLALELGAHGIRVNTVAPGLTLTDATAHLPEDIAGAVVALAGDDTGFVTGAYVPVCGGSLML
jgi:3-oxoacyl-[acyl-carrier protein] reductase